MVALGYFYLILTAAEQGVVKGSSDLANPAAGLQFISVSVYYAGGEGPAAGFGAGADDGVEVEFLAHVHLVTIEQSTGFLNITHTARVACASAAAEAGLPLGYELGVFLEPVHGVGRLLSDKLRFYYCLIILVCYRVDNGLNKSVLIQNVTAYALVVVEAG